MRKLLALFVISAVVLGTAGLAFAQPPTTESGAKIRGDINKEIIFDNNVFAATGFTRAAGNKSETAVDASSEAEACEESSDACNEAKESVLNEGTGQAYSGISIADNNVTNTDKEDINEKATAKVDCNVDVCIELETGDLLNNGPIMALDEVDGDKKGKGFLDFCDCCPAEVQGDISIIAQVFNYATAITGDAEAIGNYSATAIASHSKAKAKDGGDATNKSEVTVINTGDGIAISGDATATNDVENDICIDIDRIAESDKNVDVDVDIYAELLAR